MKIIYFNKYKEKKDNKRYANLKEELNKIEEDIASRDKDNLNFYQNISQYKKIDRFAESKGGYRLALFVYEDFCLFVDFEIKQKLENNDHTSKVLFGDYDNQYFIDYIKSNKPKEEKKFIDLNQYQDLINININQKNEEICLESKNFHQKLLSLEYKKLNKVFDLLSNKIIDYSDNSNIYASYKSIYKIEDDNLSIYYKLLIENNLTIVYLISFEENKEFFKEVDKITTRSQLLKKSVSSYSLEIFLEKFDEWREYIVKNSDGNIALSPEEEEILIEMKSYKNEKYPFFINGRAGSGKSTILQYLFAEYVVKFLELTQNYNLEYEPLYLTYNDRLKEKAIDRVCSIILANTPKNKKEKLNLKSKNVIQRQIENFFKTFETKEGYNFLEELLYLNKKPNTFKNKTKFHFDELKDYFKELIKRKGKKFKHYTPELIWYVIRSYIKGRGIIENDKLKPLSVEEYKNLPKKLKLIDEKIYQTIYNEFYHTYQKYLDENNGYDDLDLVFEIYKQKAFNKKYSIIFCDEAQDFTKIEFDLILNLNIFLSDNIKFDNLNASDIPIVFAGDPFQTINPTGFNFEYLKALVYESYQNKNLENQLNYKELRFNYRSNDEIVKFSNLIQVLRGSLFRDKNITLQTEWLENIPDTYSILLFDKLLEVEDYYQFIFPTKNIETDIEKIDTPIDIKGLEYNTIVLYGFGDFYIKNYENIEKFINEGFENKEKALPYEYFLNNFYVAITRAKEKIIIIDSNESKEKFWDKISIDVLYRKYKELNPEIKKEQLLSYKEGSVEDLHINNQDKTILVKEKLQTDIFERYDNEKNKFLILNEIEKIIKRNELDKLYTQILKGLKAEQDENSLKAVKNLMQAAKRAQKNKELPANNISYLIRKAFDNLFVSIKTNENKVLQFLNEYEEEFIKLGIKYEKRVKLLEYFLNKEYIKALEYLKDEFDIRDKTDIIEYIIINSLNQIDNYELADYVRDLFKKDFISKDEIIEIIKKRLNNVEDYRYLIKIFEIDELKKQYKDIFCKINLELNNKDIDCLVYLNKIDKVIKLIKNNEIENYKDYYKQILYYLSNSENNEKILNQLDLDLIIDNYFKHYDELKISIWKFIIKSVFDIEDKDKFNDYISILMKFFEEKTKKVQNEHLIIVIKAIEDQTKPVISKILFNTLITLFSSGIRLEICEIVPSLEKTMSFYEEENIKKILGFYGHYLREKGNKYKDFVFSRFVKIKYELDKHSKEEFIKNFKEDNSKINDEWLEFIKRRFKFLTMNAGVNIISKIPIRIDFELARKVYKLKSADKIYEKIIESYKKEKINKDVDNTKIIEQTTQKAEKPQENSLTKVNDRIIEEHKFVTKKEISTITKDNIVDILEDIQDFINTYKNSFTPREINKIHNTLSGLLNDVKDIKREK